RDAEQQKKSMDIEYRIITRTGKVRHIRLRSEFEQDNEDNVVRSFGVEQDITERKLAEEELRKTQALYNLAEQMGKLGYWEWDVSTDRLISCSEQYARIFGTTVEQELSPPHNNFNDEVARYIHEDDRELYRQVTDTAYEQKEAWDIEFRIFTITGDLCYVRELGEPVFSVDGKLIRTFGTLQDVTERKHAENELYQAKFKIEDILDKRTKELKEAQLQLIQTEKLETIGILSAGVAHEVKNPLAIIQLGVDYLIKKTKANPDVSEVINEMDDAIHRADNVIKQLVDFSASRDLHISEINVSELINDALGLVNHEIIKARIKINNVIQDHNLMISGDKQKLQQVLINIFMNSIHAIESDGMISINAKKTNMHGIDFDTTADLNPKDEYILITIKDNGMGIPENELNSIFEPFFTTKMAGQGTGLGMTVVQNILWLHKSSIHYENRQSGGIKISILFNLSGA
ncbi:MAG: PAS domain-containing protein, partial [Candidatus Marinimicrobia bacterium]|nr:PAS domain-containing protein [Candidatus Neomarinimicrobiota bacterium]